MPNSRQAAAGCAAAELGEPAVRRGLLVRPRKTRKLGVEIYRLRGETERPLTMTRWLRERGREALALHTSALVERGVLRRRPGVLLTRTRHHPDTALRTALIDGVRAVRAE
ncbi:hypothetical protein [Streptomyces hokutonensis]|uniref:hypothetical protein n=1 Tax=Streptomyces hokutonensis TaxID=1306990 RepID=UPI0036778389